MGGKTRQLSSKKGCQNLEQYCPDKVLIHDVARPFIDKDLISRLIETTKKNMTQSITHSILRTFEILKKNQLTENQFEKNRTGTGGKP